MSSSLVIFDNSDKLKMLNHDVVSNAGWPSGFLIELAVCVLPFGSEMGETPLEPKCTNL